MRAKFPQFDRPSPGRGHPIAYGPVIACAIARHADKVTSTSAVGSSSRRHQLIGRLRDQVLAQVRCVGSISGAGGRARAVFRHACKMGVEGIVSKRLGSRYRSGRSPDWLKFKNPFAPTVKREATGKNTGRRPTARTSLSS